MCQALRVSWRRRLHSQQQQQHTLFSVCLCKAFTLVLCVSSDPSPFGHTVAMAEVDPEILLEWLALGQGEERDMQVSFISGLGLP